nr:MAG TPA: hypothetical protein [Caudoviricetes sp.]
MALLVAAYWACQELLPAVECLQNHLVQKSGAFGC